VIRAFFLLSAYRKFEWSLRVSLKAGEVAMPARGYARLDRVGCTWEIKFATGETRRSPCLTHF